MIEKAFAIVSVHRCLGSDEQGWDVTNRYFPNLGWEQDDLHVFVAEFIRPALNCLWQKYDDCYEGSRPADTWYDEDKFTDRYLPGPEDPPCAFTLANPEPGAEPVVKWFDYRMQELPPPQWYLDQEERKRNDPQVLQHSVSHEKPIPAEQSDTKQSQLSQLSQMPLIGEKSLPSEKDSKRGRQRRPENVSSHMSDLSPAAAQVDAA